MNQITFRYDFKKVTEFVNVIRLDLDAKKFSRETYVQFYVESI